MRVSFAPESTAPTQPGSFVATALDASRVSLAWSASSDNVGVAGYRLYRNSALIATVTSLAYTDAGLSRATAYAYQVVAVDAAGNPSAPASASATTLTLDVDAVAPSAPANLTTTPDKGKKVTLSWAPSTDKVGVAGYRVFRDGREVATTTGTSYNDTLGGKNPSAVYFLVAFDAAGNVSAPSEQVAVTL